MKFGFPTFLKTVTLVLALATIALGVLFLYTANSVLLTMVISFGTTFYHFAMRLVVGHLIPPVKSSSAWFRPRKWEPSLYRFLRVKAWKKYLPTYDPQQFSLREHSPEDIVQNMCGAEVVHEVIMLCSFLPLLAVPLLGEFWVFFITSLLSALFDSLFVIAQRYNRPRVSGILQKYTKR